MEQIALDVLVGRLPHCARCADAYNAVMALDRQLKRHADIFDDERSGLRGGARRFVGSGPALVIRRPLRIAAALVLALAWAARWLSPIGPPADTWRGDHPAPLPVEAKYSSDHVRFEWNALPSAERYELRIWTTLGKLVVEETTVGSAIDVAYSSEEGDLALWKIDAWRGANRLASSGIRDFAPQQR